MDKALIPEMSEQVNLEDLGEEVILLVLGLALTGKGECAQTILSALCHQMCDCVSLFFLIEDTTAVMICYI